MREVLSKHKSINFNIIPKSNTLVDIEKVVSKETFKRPKSMKNMEKLFSEIFPKDENGLVKQIINLLGLPAKMIKSDKQVQELRAVRQEQQAAQAQMQQEMMQSEQAKNAAPLVQALNDGQQQQR